MADTFRVPMSFGTQKQMKPRLRSVSFGDGYELRIGDGLNTTPQIWNLNFNVLTITQANATEAFFVNHAGVRWFWWVPPRQTAAIKVVCKEWTRTPVDSTRDYDAMTATFTQVFDLQG